MQIIYFSILILAAVMELSPRFNTDNCFKKAALLLIILGALAHMANKNQMFIEVGFALYLLVDLCGAFLHDTFNRRTRK